MPFKYEPYQSTYVDPQSVEIAKTLRDRFIQNYNAADLVGQELNKLNAADFENDQKLKAELDSSVRGKLSQYAETGNYEDMTFKVSDTARDYRDRSAPITENYTRYAAYQQDLAKDYKDGKVSSAAYRNAIPLTKALGYSGISMDPKTGMVDPKSYFSGMSIVRDPEISKQLIETLKLIEADASEKTITGLYMGENGEMKYTSKKGWEGKTAEKVQQAYDSVMSRPEIQEYINQEAKFKAYETYSNPDGSLNKDALNQVAASGVQMHKQEMDKLQKLIGNPKTPQYKKDQYTATLNAYAQSLNNLNTTKEPGQLLNYASSLFKEELLAPYQAMASLQIYNKTKSEYSEDYSDMEKQNRAAAKSRELELEKLQLQAQGQISISKEGQVDETIDPAALETRKINAQANIKAANNVLNDDNAGSQEKLEAQQRLNSATEELVKLNMLIGNQNTEAIPDAVVSGFDENSVFGDTFAFGFGTEGLTFSQLWSDYQSFRNAGGAAGNLDKRKYANDFYKLVTSDPNSNPETAAFIQSVNSKHGGEDAALALQELRGSLDSKINVAKTSKVTKQRTFTTTTAPVGTNPIIMANTAKEVKEQFNTLGDLQAVQGLIYRPDSESQQISGNVEQMKEAWQEQGFKEGSKIMGVRWGVANGLELTDKSQYGQYAIFTIAPEEEGETVSGKPYKEVYVPIESIVSADQLAELNKPTNRIGRMAFTAGAGTDYKKSSQTYEYQKQFSDTELNAIRFSNELQNKNSADGAKFLKENAEVFAQYQANGYLAADGSFIGTPAKKIIIKVDGVTGPDSNPQAEIFLENIDGRVEPMMEYDSQGNLVRAGKMSMSGQRFTSIVNDQNLGLYNPSGYNLVNGY
jgi:hypothetical protein